MKKLILALFVPFIMASCGTEIYEIAATGKPYEILVVTPKTKWSGAIKDTMASIFSKPVEWITQHEPIFDLMQVIPEGLNDLSRRHRNLLFIKIDPSVDSSTLTITQDKWANGQLIMDLVAPSDSVAAIYLSANKAEIVEGLSVIERQRMSERGKKYSDDKITQMIRDKFGFTMYIPTGYRVRNDTTNFLWISYEMPLSSQGVVIYTFKKENDKKLNFIDQRNIAVAKIPGPVVNSYMSTDTTFRPEIVKTKINGREWFEIRGFWNVKGDFMGGSFIDYVTYDSLQQKYIGIDMYVYSPSPKYPKRNYLRQLEALMINVEVK